MEMFITGSDIRVPTGKASLLVGKVTAKKPAQLSRLRAKKWLRS